MAAIDDIPHAQQPSQPVHVAESAHARDSCSCIHRTALRAINHSIHTPPANTSRRSSRHRRAQLPPQFLRQ
ncbi:hypothetical protein BJX96DRAFT_151261 [Aspergillus floccosus]